MCFVFLLPFKAVLFPLSLQAPLLQTSLLQTASARLFRTRGRQPSDSTSYHPPCADWLPSLTRHSCDCCLQRKPTGSCLSAMNCALWNGAAATPSAAVPPYLSALDDGVSEKQRWYSPTGDEKREKRERPRYSGRIGRGSFPVEHQAQNTAGHTSKANCFVLEPVPIRLISRSQPVD